eukprot:CAMPEP_0170613116 /NCGR_PEP_ID=MMETSP0224-20130122/24099_1 /TAXON_ID=285029 /ORGANISM="Togula jolla, Strain CCCM 725" /LENGTH=115 /DNA_ID=CAMNT_0010938693 /DNA_START=298 /DNA_END=646 /DNA_ORIENTATION=-
MVFCTSRATGNVQDLVVGGLQADEDGSTIEHGHVIQMLAATPALLSQRSEFLQQRWNEHVGANLRTAEDDCISQTYCLILVLHYRSKCTWLGYKLSTTDVRSEGVLVEKSRCRDG